MIPNGRNADGSLKSIEYIQNEVLIFTVPTNYGNPTYFSLGYDFAKQAQYAGYKISADAIKALGNVMFYDDESNIIKGTGDSGKTLGILQTFYAFMIRHTNGKITSLIPNTVFHALDYNNKDTISGWSMPSSRHIDLSLGASGNTYTAPANGYVWLRMKSTSNNLAYCEIITSSKIGIIANTNTINHIIECFCPVQIGYIFQTFFNNATVEEFKFIYTEGER